MAANDIITRLRMQGQVAYSNAATAASKSLAQVDTAGKHASKSVQATGDAATKAKRPLGNIGGSIKGFVAGAAAAYGAQKLVTDAVGSAVDLGEQLNKTAVVFRGPGAQAIESWSKTTATALGMSQRQALEAAGVFGNMLVPMGFARGKAADMSKSMVGLASDMASFNNASPDETLQALRSGLAGETEPLRRFGVFLSDARLKQQAMSMGLYEGKGVLDANAKAQATYALIVKDTKDAQGDFQRTSSSLANQQRILKAQYEQTAASIGKYLIPVITWLIKNLPEVLIVVGAAIIAWGAWTVSTMSLTAAWGSLSAAMLANPVGVVIVAVIALVAAFVIAYRKIGWFRSAVNATWNALKTAGSWIASHTIPLFKLLWQVIKNHPLVYVIRHFGELVGVVKSMPGKIASAAVGMWDGIKDAFRSAVNWIVGGWNSLEFRIPGFDPPGPGPKFGGFTLGVPDIPMLAYGGNVQRAGAAIIGENGPELVELPRGASVTPFAASSAAAPSIASGLGSWRVEVPVYLHRRQIALAVADDTSDRIARR